MTGTVRCVTEKDMSYSAFFVLAFLSSVVSFASLVPGSLLERTALRGEKVQVKVTVRDTDNPPSYGMMSVLARDFPLKWDAEERAMIGTVIVPKYVNSFTLATFTARISLSSKKNEIILLSTKSKAKAPFTFEMPVFESPQLDNTNPKVKIVSSKRLSSTDLRVEFEAWDESGISEGGALIWVRKDSNEYQFAPGKISCVPMDPQSKKCTADFDLPAFLPEKPFKPTLLVEAYDLAGNSGFKKSDGDFSGVRWPTRPVVSLDDSFPEISGVKFVKQDEDRVTLELNHSSYIPLKAVGLEYIASNKQFIGRRDAVLSAKHPGVTDLEISLKTPFEIDFLGLTEVRLDVIAKNGQLSVYPLPIAVLKQIDFAPGFTKKETLEVERVDFSFARSN